MPCCTERSHQDGTSSAHHKQSYPLVLFPWWRCLPSETRSLGPTAPSLQASYYSTCLLPALASLPLPSLLGPSRAYAFKHLHNSPFKKKKKKNHFYSLNPICLPETNISSLFIIKTSSNSGFTRDCKLPHKFYLQMGFDPHVFYF